jgi:4-carboxymuconolactone decarboxylase
MGRPAAAGLEDPVPAGCLREGRGGPSGSGQKFQPQEDIAYFEDDHSTATSLRQRGSNSGFRSDTIDKPWRRTSVLSDEDIRKKTKETANKLFGQGIRADPPYRMWKAFDRDLANDFSKFITGNLYSRTVLTLPERQMAACAMLAALRASDELRLHVNAALNVGCDPRKLAEIFFQLATYAGMPAVNEALQVYRDVLKERGEWPIE